MFEESISSPRRPIATLEDYRERINKKLRIITIGTMIH